MRIAEPDPADDDLTALLRRFELPLLHYATRILGDRDRARDVVQETFVELQRMTYLDDQILEKEEGHDPAPNEESSGRRQKDFSSGSSPLSPRGSRKCCS